jgi:hypothetical protein
MEIRINHRNSQIDSVYDGNSQSNYPSSLGHLSIGVGCATARIFFGFALAGSSIMSLGHVFQFVGYGLSRCIPYHFGTTAFGKSSRINWTTNTHNQLINHPQLQNINFPAAKPCFQPFPASFGGFGCFFSLPALCCWRVWNTEVSTSVTVFLCPGCRNHLDLGTCHLDCRLI